ncbi:hypothetical protein CR162_11215 [Pseudoroseomonas rhizosphaerae]|uniref:Phasin domain-containing protein n=1 Tax=Teichococcus rhizosphaerae TaxID=1335062 RepID=A0A2C6Z8M6_9PROT|nr:hypothetical protein [Pseudoroseomonas rhizosphaerae]PHK94851.1 hypothetical protein CR162_11215 [Pseudoroseomonas rhizosphaerae]
MTDPFTHGQRAARHANAVLTTLEAARQVIDHRLSADAAQRRGPVATLLEVGRMVPEKMLAFSAGGAALAQGGMALGQRTAEYAMAELEAAHGATLRAAAAPSPLAVASAQAEWALGAMTRAQGFSAAWAGLCLSMAEQSLRPVRSTVAGNRRRLRG